MSFIEEAQAWLCERGEPVPAPQALPPGVDLDRCREAMWEALESIRGHRQQRAAHADWSPAGVLERYVAHVVAELRRGVGARWDGARLTDAVTAILVADIRYKSLDDFDGRRVLGMELQRIGDEAAARLGLRYAGVADEVSAWCHGVRAVGADGQVTSIGRALIGLAGREATHLGVELEVSLSTGPFDKLRASRSALRALATGPQVYLEEGPPEDDPPFSRTTFRRLVRMGLATHEGHEGYDGFTLAEDARELVATVLDPEPNPFRALVRVLLDAERGRLATSVTGVAAAPGTDLAYVRMVVHELRNTTLPLANALDRLWGELEKPAADPTRVGELRKRIVKAMTRIEDFTRDSARLAEVVADETFSLRQVVEEAVAATEPDRNGRIRVALDTLGDAELSGPRVRWVLLFVNLFRNAAQARAGSGTIWVSTSWTVAGSLWIEIDDDGPGVPEELRERIFELGVSQRGGSGLGLHEARTTVLLTGGQIACQPAPTGGARFHIQVPARRRP